MSRNFDAFHVFTYVFGRYYIQDRMDYICYNLNNK